MPAGRRGADTAEAESFRHQVRSVHHWLTHADDVDITWRRAAGSTDTVVSATVDQLADLNDRLREVILAWSGECLADRELDPSAGRRPTRVVARAFPSGPVRP